MKVRLWLAKLLLGADLITFDDLEYVAKIDVHAILSQALQQALSQCVDEVLKNALATKHLPPDRMSFYK